MLFSVYGSVHRWSVLMISNETQHKAVYLLFCKFTLHVSGVNQPPVLCSYLPPTWPTWPYWREVAAQNMWPVPESLVTVLCAPDDGCGWHPKHVESTFRIINRLLCVASSWTIINTGGMRFRSAKIYKHCSIFFAFNPAIKRNTNI